MADVFTKAKRSEVMSRIRGRGNKGTELALMKVFRAHRITGWRRQKVLIVRSSRRKEAHSEDPRSKSVRASLPRLLRVRVDFIFPKLKVTVFVDGCFWHGCPKHSSLPARNRPFWRRKLTANKRRDLLVTRTLRRRGWRVLRIWEHELVRKNEMRLVSRVQRALV
jgi:DNA mismatch endonuclease (patch repair protein)